MGLYAFVSAGGGSIGLLAGGALTQSLDWHWIFFVNVPIGVIAFVLGSALIEENEGIGLGRRRRRARLGADHRWRRCSARSRSSSRANTACSRRARSAPAAARWRCSRAFLALEARLANPIMPLRDPAPADADGLEPRARPARHGHVLGLLPRRALPRARARLRRDRNGPRVPAADGRDRGDVAGRLGARRRALRRRAARSSRGPRRDRRRARCCSPRRACTRATSRACSSRSCCSGSARARRSCRC